MNSTISTSTSRTRRDLRGFTLTVACVLTVGCESARDVTAPATPLRTTGTARLGVQLTLDDRLAMLADLIPGFGGWYIDGAGKLHIYLQNRAQLDHARGVLERHRSVRGVDLTQIQFEQGQYDFRDLRMWRMAIQGEASAISGVLMFDIDEATNRVVIGVENEGARSAVLARAAAWPISPAALRVEIRPRAVPVAILADFYRPLVGGLLHEFAPTGGGGISGGCSLTMIMAGWPGGARDTSDRYAVVSSHCTSSPWAVDGWHAFQNCSGLGCSSRHIGVETDDINGWTGAACTYAGTQCRYADAALVLLDDSLSANAPVGYIARTTWSGLTVGSDTIGTAPNDRFRVVQDGNMSGIDVLEDIAAPGQPIEKMGHRTGWTVGTISSTCAAYPANYSPALTPTPWLECQYKATAYGNNGDSGAPVFFRLNQTDSDGRQKVAWAGIVSLKEATGTTPGPFIFSSYDMILNELQIARYWTP